MSKRIYRWEIPGKFDQLPYGTEIIRLKSTVYNEAELYKQLSKDQNKPYWESMGTLESTVSTAHRDSSVSDITEESLILKNKGKK